MQVGDTVQIKSNDLLLDCCQGKRGRIAHVPVGGEGWLLCTDHFCPIVRSESELKIVPDTVLASEHMATKSDPVRKSYENQPSERLREFVPVGDKTAWAVLILRGEAIA